MTLQETYQELKESYYRLEDCATMKKYRLLHKAKLIGLKIYGKKYTIQQLADDFEIPITTVKRVLSLEKANKKTWALIRSKQLSPFKAAMTLMTKDNYYQDEVVGMVVQHNLSTYQIKQIRVKEYKDVAKNNTRFACAAGYSRQHEAYYKFLGAIEKLELFLDMDKSFLSEKNKIEIKKRLDHLNKEIGEWNG